MSSWAANLEESMQNSFGEDIDNKCCENNRNRRNLEESENILNEEILGGVRIFPSKIF
jgi:hypothetical protein